VTPPRTVEEQLQAVLATCHPLEGLELPVLEAGGCVLAEDVYAQRALPPFATVTHEGYAVRAVDLAGAGMARPARLTVVDAVGAGHRASAPLGPGEAIRVAAGAMLPEGSDAVVPLGQTDGGTGAVLVGAVVAPGAGTRPAGQFARPEQLALRAGTQLGPAQLGAAVAAGRSRLLVYPAPRVVLITVGSELVAAGGELQPGLIHDVNSIMLSAAVLQTGAVAYRAGPVPDDPAVLASVIEGQLVRADLIVVTGGTGGVVGAAMSQLGSFDPVPVAVVPGPVVAFGEVGGRIPVMSLPGEPTSAMVNFEVFVRPAIRRLMGNRRLFRPVTRARLRAPVQAPVGLRRFVPVAVSGRGDDHEAEPVPSGQENSPLAFVSVNGLAVVPEEVATMEAGEDVLLIRMDRD